MHRHWSNEEIAQLTRLHLEGKSTVQIARVLQTKTLTQIRKFILNNRYELGLEYRFQPKNPSPDPTGSFHNHWCRDLLIRRWPISDS